ncbi:hypothetical protein Goshw_014886 [Gossypium schwendimanii]|uniref:Uncharacterized protein n=1 Tax=Gossypium schwendimanii TaxID=34291 RepID=A0A7J9ND13_GOSSC|nr:hypothetical protein [Gossypium schwendimanii]
MKIQFHVTSDIVILLAVSQFSATKTPFSKLPFACINLPALVHTADYPKGDSSFINNQRPSNFILEAPFILRIDKSGWKRSLALIIQGVVSVSCAE